jgi:hypothetical protein
MCIFWLICFCSGGVGVGAFAYARFFDLVMLVLYQVLYKDVCSIVVLQDLVASLSYWIIIGVLVYERVDGVKIFIYFVLSKNKLN